VRAFEVSAVDYLVKPVDRERFDRTLGRVRRRTGGPHAAELRALLGALRAADADPVRFVVRDARGHYFVRLEDVESARAEGNYIALHDGQRLHLVRETLRRFEDRVDPARFIRIHRSTIVNLDRIARIEPEGHGEYRVVMRSGARLESSRAHSERLRALLR
jgi:two-component system LytT family response regulator